MQIIDNTALKFTIPSILVRSVADSIEKSHVLQTAPDISEVLMHWGLPECIALTKIQDTQRPQLMLPDPVSPILSGGYNWPGFYTPFQHQKATAAFLSLRQRAFCFNEAGTGKTSAAIWAADYLMNEGLISRVLVIGPLSILQTAWQADILATAMHRSSAIAHGDSDRRRKIIHSDIEFVITNFDGARIEAEELAKASFDLIIVDEANAYKDTSSKRWKSLAKLIKPHTWLWMMTGTPASQSPLDAFGLARLVSPERIPKYATAWRDRVMQQLSRFKWVPKKTADKDVFQVLQPAIRFEKKDCLDLPDVIYQTRHVPMTPATQKYYNTLKTQMLAEAAGTQIRAVNAASAINKLLQISGGAVYNDDKDVVQFDIGPRLDALKEVLDETTNKVVVFVPYLHTIDTVHRFLLSKKIPTAIIHGGVSGKARSDIINLFQRSTDPRVLIVQPQSASHGVTLTAADTVVFWGPVMSVETYIQCIGRIDRLGQKHRMTVVHMEGSQVERARYAMLQGKVNAHQNIVDLYKHVFEEE